MRISDWSSDVCSSDLSSGQGRGGRYEGSMVEGALVCQVGSPQVGGIVRSAKSTIVFNPQVKHVVSGRLAFVVGQSVLAEDAICLDVGRPVSIQAGRSEEHTSELQSLMRISYAVFCLNKKTPTYVSS